EAVGIRTIAACGTAVARVEDVVVDPDHAPLLERDVPAAGETPRLVRGPGVEGLGGRGAPVADQPLVAIARAGRPDVQTPPVGAVEAPEAQLRLGMHQGAAAGAKPAHLGISFGPRGRVVGAPGERCFLLSLQTVQLGLEDRVGVVDVVLLCRDLVADGQRPAPFLRAKARRRRSGVRLGEGGSYAGVEPRARVMCSGLGPLRWPRTIHWRHARTFCDMSITCAHGARGFEFGIRARKLWSPPRQRPVTSSRISR